jgi:hypothetical protein
MGDGVCVWLHLPWHFAEHSFEGLGMNRLVVIFAVFLCQAASALDLFSNLQPRAFQLADSLEAGATVGGYPIWAGEGKWRIFNIARTDSTGGTTIPFGNVGLFQTEGKNVVALMTISANLSGGSARWLGEPCKREDMLYKANIGKSVWQDNCVTINHITNYGNNPTGRDGELYVLLVQQGISPPPTVLQVTFTRNGTSGNTITTRVMLNPEVLGFARESEVSWGKNPWNKLQSFNDPAKKQFIDALGAWALQFAKQMDDALEQKPEAFASIPSWRSVLQGQPAPALIKSKIILD